MWSSSDWSYWDVHIHAPGTALNDQFEGDWEGYLRTIEEADPAPVALGITDYCSIVTYKQFRMHWENGRAKKVELIFPNIEFRLMPKTTRGNALNLHLLVSPEDDRHVEEIEDALSRLTFESAVRRYPCTREGLIALGRAHDPNAADDEIARIVGVGQFKVDVSVFLDWLKKETWIQRNALVAIAGGNDGLSGIRKDDGFRQYHDQLVRSADMIFSATPSDREHYGGISEAADVLDRMYGGLKPCLHGSDAHEIARVLRPDEDRYCWIKAAPTFDGLRQVVFEPIERVHIGSLPPVGHDPDQIIRSVRVLNHGDWFQTPHVPLSGYLNAIIGEKGTGKTALADLIAAAAGAWKPADTSFLRKAADHLRGTEIQLEWQSGRRSTLKVSELEDSSVLVPEVRYLSQQFVERLCSGDTITDELVEEVERVVFEHIPAEDRLNTTSFDELRSKRTEALRRERNELRRDIIGLNEEIENILDSKSQAPKKQLERRKADEEIKRLAGQLNDLITPQTSDVATKVDILQEELEDLQSKAASISERILLTANLREKISRAQAQIAEWYNDLTADLEKAGIAKSEWHNFALKFQGDPYEPIDKHERSLSKKLADIQGSDEDSEDAKTIAAKSKELAAEQKKLQLDEQRRKAVVRLQREISKTKTRVRQLKEEEAELERRITHDLPRLQKRRLEFYLRYFDLLSSEARTLESLYVPLVSELAARDTGERELEFEVVTAVDVSSWANKGEDMLDLRRAGNLTRRGALEDLARTQLEQSWRDFEKNGIRNGLEKVITELRDGGIRQKLRDEYTPRDVADWLFSVDHVKLDYGLKYKGTPLRLLSPGTRGIVLLILYLAIDIHDDRPLVVDQPEENLDNASVYSVLVNYFRRAKQRRQIIVVTHNPNLVVNTDAESVIVATADRRPDGLPQITYEIGPLERIDELSGESEIKERVCAILEGGRPAFKKRDARYN